MRVIGCFFADCHLLQKKILLYYIGCGTPNSKDKGCDGFFVDGEPIQWRKVLTKHGEVFIEGNLGMTITGSFAQHQGDKEKTEPSIFNL